MSRIGTTSIHISHIVRSSPIITFTFAHKNTPCNDYVYIHHMPTTQSQLTKIAHRLCKTHLMCCVDILNIYIYFVLLQMPLEFSFQKQCVLSSDTNNAPWDRHIHTPCLVLFDETRVNMVRRGSRGAAMGRSPLLPSRFWCSFICKFTTCSKFLF